MLDGEPAQNLKNVLLDSFSILFGVVGVIGKNYGREVGTIDRIVHRDSDLKLGIIIENDTSNASPHRLKDVVGV
jgi:hypothetical protein